LEALGGEHLAIALAGGDGEDGAALGLNDDAGVLFEVDVAEVTLNGLEGFGEADLDDVVEAQARGFGGRGAAARARGGG
jgi:hypothetical protein